MPEIRLLEGVHELEEVCALFAGTWPSPDGHPPTSVGLLRSLAYTGNYVAGVFAKGRMVAAAVAFLGRRDARITLFSNQVAVRSDEGSRGIGFGIHQHMRLWALERGVDEINWTFDPMIVRNAYFFIHKVGAIGLKYLPDFYGGSYDPGNDASDRVFAVWDLTSGKPSRDTDAGELPLALRAGEDGGPLVDPDAARASRFAVELHADIKCLRASNAMVANRWRAQVREILGAALASGARLVEVTRHGRYVIER